MLIVIPTYRRASRQYTLEWLSEKQQERTVFVCDETDDPRLAEHHPGIRRVVVPPEVTTIASKRAWIIRESCGGVLGDQEKIVMMDDDLRFSVRIEPGNNDNRSLRKAYDDDVDIYLDQLEAKLDDYHHAGWSPRQGNNNMRPGWFNTVRMMYVLGYRPRTLLEECELGRIETREDMDYTLQLLKWGYDNTICGDIAVDQYKGFAAEGGASKERTMERSNADAFRLQELHPHHVSVTSKEYLISIDRNEVICSWKQAYKFGKKRRQLRDLGR